MVVMGPPSLTKERRSNVEHALQLLKWLLLLLALSSCTIESCSGKHPLLFAATQPHLQMGEHFYGLEGLLIIAFLFCFSAQGSAGGSGDASGTTDAFLFKTFQFKKRSGPFSIPEGEQAVYTVRMDGPPTSDVTLQLQTLGNYIRSETI